MELYFMSLARRLAHTLPHIKLSLVLSVFICRKVVSANTGVALAIV